MLYELRKYEVMPGKLPALVDRFGSFTVEKWKQHGLRLIGFWTPEIGPINNQVIYIWGWESFEERQRVLPAWQSDPERARVWAETERNGVLVRRVNNLLMEATSFSQLDHGVAYGPPADGRAPYLFELREYEVMPGKLNAVVKRFGEFTIKTFEQHGFRQVGYWTPVMGGHNHQLIYILAWENPDHRDRAWKAWRADPERQQFFAESEKDGPLVERIANLLMVPTPFSPLK